MNKCLNCSKKVTNKYCNVTCQNQHKRVINEEKYNLNPKLCDFCNSPIEYSKRRNKFCDHSCSASKNNVGVNRNTDKSIFNSVSDEIFKKLAVESSSWADLSRNLGYTGNLKSSIKENIIKRAKDLNVEICFNKAIQKIQKDLIKNQNKGDIFKLSKNWQAGRTAIRKDACKVYKESGKGYKCLECGYDKHVEIAHIKAVSEFNDESFLEEINHIDNLVALCPNHHWEYDNNGLKLIKN